MNTFDYTKGERLYGGVTDAEMGILPDDKYQCRDCLVILDDDGRNSELCPDCENMREVERLEALMDDSHETEKAIVEFFTR